MAKGKGGYGSSSSSSSGCYYCNEPLLLAGYNWKSSKTDALFALQCIAVIVLVVCLGLMAKFKWTRQNGARDTGRSVAYALATVSSIIYFIFVLVDTGLREAVTETTYLYKLTSIFRALFWRISELVILMVVLKTIIAATSSGVARALKVAKFIAISLVGALTISSFGITVALIAYQLKNGPYDDHDSLGKSQVQVFLAYESLYLVTVVFAAVLSFIVLIKERSLATLLMSVAVIPALFLRILIDLANDAYYYTIYYTDSYYSYNYKTTENLGWADVYIYVLMTIVIFLGLAIIGIRRPKISSTTAYGSQHQKVEYGNAGYGNNGNPGYTNPGYGNATHVPVYN